VNYARLFQALAAISDEVENNIAEVNAGGCGVFAGIIGQHLERIGLVCDVATQIHEWGKPAKAVRKTLDTSNATAQMWWDNGLDGAHLVLRFKIGNEVHMYDALGVNNSEIFERWLLSRNDFGLGLTVQETVIMSSKKRGWNSRFDRSQIPAIQEIADTHLSEFDTGEFACTTASGKPIRVPSTLLMKLIARLRPSA
jgi:hypothetical protein